MRRLIAILLFEWVMAGCGGSDSAPPAPSPASPPPPAQVQLAVFMDPASSFSTSDVRDSEDIETEIVQFDVANNALIWKPTGQSFPGYPVSGTFVAADKHFKVRFGTMDRQRRD